MIETALSALGTTEIGAMIVFGLLFGSVILWLSPTIARGDGLWFVMALIVILGLGFFISRGVALFVADSALWPRNIGFAILWVIYSAAVAGGVLIRRRIGAGPEGAR